MTPNTSFENHPFSGPLILIHTSHSLGEKLFSIGVLWFFRRDLGLRRQAQSGYVRNLRFFCSFVVRSQYHTCCIGGVLTSARHGVARIEDGTR